MGRVGVRKGAFLAERAHLAGVARSIFVSCSEASQCGLFPGFVQVDPIRDLEIIANELRLKDIAMIEKLIDPLKKEVRHINIS